MFSKKRNVIAVVLTLLMPGIEPAFSQPEEEWVPASGRAVVGRVFGLKDQGGDIDYYAFDLSGRSRFNPSFRSLLVPGWGQHFNRQNVKGSAFFITTMAAAFGSVMMYEKSQDSLDAHRNGGSVENDDFDDYENERTVSLVLGGLAGVLWTINVIDAYRNAYDPLYQTRVPLDVRIDRDGAYLQWDQEF